MLQVSSKMFSILYTETCYLMEILSSTFTITAEVNMGKQAPEQMPISFSSVLLNKLK